jgi:S1-C subfamily serine protease
VKKSRTTSLTGLVAVFTLTLFLLIPLAARAQDRVWVQIEAQPTRAEALERARAYSSAFPDVQGYALRSGWYGILLGPYSRSEAAARLADLKQERLIPSDSFIAFERNFRDPFWPPAGTEPTQPAPVSPEATAPEAETVIPVDPMPEPDALAALTPDPTPAETPAEARASEAALDLAARQEVQTALQWFGFYDAAIDGAFGSGTRAAMTAWQEANAAEPTGVLTTLQRNALVSAHQAALAELGLARVTEPEAGIVIDLPLAMVEFDRYEPPFVRYREKDGSGVQALLISQPGDERTLFGLYDIMQTLEIVPSAGERTRGERSFEISGRNDRIESYTRVELERGLVKGFTLVWPAADTPRMTRVIEAMKASFRPSGDRALDPGLAPMDPAQKQGMLSGLEVRRPTLSRSGFYVDATGSVLTTAELVQSCGRITIDGDQEMTVRLADAASGLALLAPATALAPPGIAAFQAEAERPGAEVSVAGYPYEDALNAPTLTFGAVAALTGLDGEPGVKRLSLPARPGDAGGPVLDGTGAVVGMLLPADADPARKLPDDVAFAAPAAGIETFLRTQGITPVIALASGALPPEDLTRRARAMTVLVSCWP